jgi:hypothetical protein
VGVWRSLARAKQRECTRIRQRDLAPSFLGFVSLDRLELNRFPERMDATAYP